MCIDKMRKTILYLFPLILLLLPSITMADLIVPIDPGRSGSIGNFGFELAFNFISLTAVFHIILNALIAWLFVFLFSKIIIPTAKLKKITYLLFSFIGYFIDKISFFLSYHLFGKYSCNNVFAKSYCEYNFINSFNESWVILIAGLVIFIGVSFLAYFLFSKKLYSSNKQRLIFSTIAGIVLNPWWWKLLF